MTILAVSNPDEPPEKINRPPSSLPPSLFFSLPSELIFEILARVPKRYYPIVSCVCKNLASFVRSPEIHRIRSVLGLDSLYICFWDKNNHRLTNNWFTLRKNQNNPRKNRFVSIGSISHPDLEDTSTVAVGQEIFFVGAGSLIPSSSLWIFDSRSGKFRKGPNKQVAGLGDSVALVGGYNRDEDIRVELFDLKNQIWELAPFPEESRFLGWSSDANVSLDRKVYVLGGLYGMASYDPRNGSCEKFEMPKDQWSRTEMCVIENVLYVYYGRFGLMWFDTKLVLWRVVFGLRHLKKVRPVGIAEYYGKLAFLWEEYGFVKGETKEIWCRMIALERCQVGICGTPYSAQLLGSVPCGYILEHCISVSD